MLCLTNRHKKCTCTKQGIHTQTHSHYNHFLKYRLLLYTHLILAQLNQTGYAWQAINKHKARTFSFYVILYNHSWYKKHIIFPIALMFAFKAMTDANGNREKRRRENETRDDDIVKRREIDEVNGRRWKQSSADFKSQAKSERDTF